MAKVHEQESTMKRLKAEIRTRQKICLDNCKQIGIAQNNTWIGFGMCFLNRKAGTEGTYLEGRAENSCPLHCEIMVGIYYREQSSQGICKAE